MKFPRSMGVKGTRRLEAKAKGLVTYAYHRIAGKWASYCVED